MLVKTKKELKAQLSALEKNHGLGLVPTMGALHRGHISLIEMAAQDNGTVVVTIFVNPTQFTNKEDLAKYPNTLEADLRLIESVAKKTIVFAPSVAEIYNSAITAKSYAFDGLDQVMEGVYRQGHFNGVGTIVDELFTLIKPNRAYFGEKDFQQLQIIRKLVSLRNHNVEVIGCPIVRENSGLAMSSRNERLSTVMRNKAAMIYETLVMAKHFFGTESAAKVCARVLHEFNQYADLGLEYFVIADEDNLKPVRKKMKSKKYRAFIAVYAEGVRLIDNIALD